MTDNDRDAIIRLTTVVEEARADIRDIGKRLDTAIEQGTAHRQEMDRRITRLEEQQKSAITYRQLLMWAMGAGGSGIAGGILAGLLAGGGVGGP